MKTPTSITLYHGTSSKRLAEILRDGILPRSETRPGNFKGVIESRKGFVYLSDAFPIFYASNAASTDQSDNMLVLQVSVPVRSLYPDEDFIGQVLHQEAIRRGESPELLEVTEGVSLMLYKHAAKASLDHMGSVAVRKVKPEQIIGYRELPSKDTFAWARLGGDQSVNIWARRLVGSMFKTRLDLWFEQGLMDALLYDPFKASLPDWPLIEAVIRKDYQGK